MTSMADYSIQAGILNALIQPYNAIVQQTAFTYLYNDLHKRLNFIYLTKNATSAQLPNGLYINNVNGAPYNMPDDYDPPTQNISQFLSMTSFGTGNASRTNTFANSDSLLWAMGFLKLQAPETNSSHSNGWPNISINALECGLFYCVNEYSPTVRNGILEERETLVHNARRSSDSWSLIDYTYPNLDGIEIDNHSMNSLEFNNSTSSWSRTDLMLGDGFNLSWAAVTSLSSQFQSQFTSPKTINMSEHTSPLKAPNYIPINGFYKNQVMSYDSTAVEFSPSIMQILYDTSDLDDTFRRLARGLSNAIRAGSDDAEMRTGTSGVMTTYYRIWWPWITLHALVALGGMSFLLGTIIGSRASGVPIWKSSTLAMLSLTVSDMIGDTLVGVDLLEDMEAKASQHFLQLFDNRAERESGAEGA
ncbi:hypothetical protein N0V90_002860 [Kalmusia sp. IMI 367209]|nr:hypothetical protein N0V90_002860 [Kalmusia sp. IMI 367209]